MCDEDVILSLENLVLFCGLVNIQNDNQPAYVCIRLIYTGQVWEALTTS